MANRFCDRCGLLNRAGARFCARCGSELSKDEAQGVGKAPDPEQRQPEPTSQSAVRRVRRPRGRLLAALVALALIGFLYVVYSASAATTFSAAEDAHKRFDCSQAVAKYNRLTGFYSIAVTAHRGTAMERRSECRAVLEAESVAQERNHRGAAQLYAQILEEHEKSPILEKLRVRRAEELLSWGDSLMRRASDDLDLLAVALKRYETVLAELPETSETEAAKTRMVRLWASANSGVVCSRADSMLVIGAGEYVSEEARVMKRLATEKAPGYMLGCGNQLIADRQYRLAARKLRQLIREFGGTQAARRAKGPLIDAEVGQIRGGGTAALPEPTVSGSTGGEEVELAIRNSSPYSVELLLSGPSSRRFTVPRCSGCREFSEDNPPASCPPGPRRTFILQPGAYAAVVRAPGRDITPWAGDWTLSSGVQYGHCFYIVTSPR
jgi:hypothetical protein